jgi:transcriptional regulator with XRE-family HTH domain
MRCVDVRPAFGRRVRELRRQKRLSQEQLAARADLHWTYVSGVERGLRNPGLNTLVRLANALDVSLPELLADLIAQSAKRARGDGAPPKT